MNILVRESDRIPAADGNGCFLDPGSSTVSETPFGRVAAVTEELVSHQPAA
jgi:hypothetical protein